MPLRAELRALIRGALTPRRRLRAAKLIVFAQGRTGSTLLGDLLASHPDFHFADELLRPRARWPARYLEGRRAAHAGEAFCVHVKPYQLTDFQDVADLGGWLRERHAAGWLIVHLRRENLLRHVLSNFMRRELGVSHLTVGDGRERPHVQVDPAQLLASLDARAEIGSWEREAVAGLEHESLVYERDLLDPSRWQPAAERVWRYAGLSPVPVSTELRRINAGRLEELIANYDEVRAALAGTPHERFLVAPAAG